MSDPTSLLNSILERRLEAPALDWYRASSREIAGGVDDVRFASLIALASRHIARGPLAPDEAELKAASAFLAGWSPERWTLFESVRVALLLARNDLEQQAGFDALESSFRYADEGELCALYRSLAFLPDGKRFAWRAGEGCRTNMLTVFEAVACDTPYPAQHFDELAWNQMVIKGLFVGAPVWRIWRLDERLSSELARMALDLVEERTSAGRDIQPELWSCLGVHGGERGLGAMRRELNGQKPAGRAAAALGLVRAGRTAEVRPALDMEQDSLAAEVMRSALQGNVDQMAFGPLHL